MIIQTIQPLCVLEKLQSEGIVRAISYLEKDFISEQWGFAQSYEWMKKQMNSRQIYPEVQDKDLFWGWAWSGDRNQKKIDLRTRKHENKPGHVILTLDKSDDDILLSEFGLWHHVLNYWPICVTSEQEIYWDEIVKNEIHNFYQHKPLKNHLLHEKISSSWNHIFRIKNKENYFHLNLEPEQLNYLGIDENEKMVVQATFWNIRIDELKSFKILG